MPEFPEVRLQVQYLQERLDDWEIEAYGYKGKRQFKNLPTQVYVHLMKNTACSIP